MQYLTNKGTFPYGLSPKTTYKDGMSAKPNKTSLSYLFTTANAIQDRLSGRWSYIDTFDNITIPLGLDAYVQTFYVIGKILDVKAGENVTEVQIIDPDGEVFSKVAISGVLADGGLIITMLFVYNRFVKTGKYYLRVIQNGKRLADHNKFFFTVERQKDDKPNL